MDKSKISEHGLTVVHDHKIHPVADLAVIESAFHFGAGTLKDVVAVLFDKVGPGLHAVELD